jgi:membrane protease YdiL (CAAX protease family)
MKRTASPTGHGDLEASLVLVFPLLLAYAIGVLFTGRVNGADVGTRVLYTLCGGRTAYLLVYAAVALLFLLWIRRGDRWGTLRLGIVAPVVLEAAIYAFTLGALITLVLDLAALPFGGAAIGAQVPAGERLLGLGIDGTSAIAALGAGVHEELVFRLGLMVGLVALLRGLDHRFALVLALVASSLVFAAAHHLGAHGEPFTTYAFLFRTLAGAAFGAIFWFRSLAHAVYAHVLYDLVVAAQ